MLDKNTRIKVLAVAAFIFPLLYALYTEQMWEDFFIMFRHSKNLADGFGLTFNPGAERVHGFTSPLATLLLAFFYFITGKSSYIAPLWCFRIVSALAFSGAAVTLYQLAKKNAKHAATAVFLFFFFTLDIKALAFSSNGMETAFMLLFISLTIRNLTEANSKNFLAGGLSFAGLMWTRPDGCLYIAVMGITSLLFFPDKKEKFTALVKMCLVCTVLYLPWFLWAFWYFGSPIPQPVHAKQAAYDFSLIATGGILKVLLERAEMAFYPIYTQFGGWPWWLEYVVRPQALFCLVYWVIPIKDRLGRQASFCFMAMCLYLTGVYPYPWYLPSPALFAWLTLALGLNGCLELLTPKLGKLAYAPVVGFLCLIVFNIIQIDVQGAYSSKIIQAEVEMKNRRQVGLWLNGNVQKNETIFAECIGYIGYFADRTLLDFPGLATPKVSQMRKVDPRGMLDLVPDLNPDWIVVRGKEVNGASYPEYFKAHYRFKTTFDATARLNQVSPFPGRGYADLDSVFSVYHRESN